MKCNTLSNQSLTNRYEKRSRLKELNTKYKETPEGGLAVSQVLW